MKIVFDHPEPAMLVHGGMLTQIQQTAIALRALGCEVENLRWWDESQTADIIHCFGRMPPYLVETAQAKGIKVVLSELLAVQGSRSRRRLALQRGVMRLLMATLPPQATMPFRWRSYAVADAVVALTSWEAHLFSYLFGAAPAKVHVVPNGVEPVFLDSEARPRGPWLVCTATIAPRKQVVELARAAVLAQTPLWVIGKPYSETDAYGREFRELAAAHPQLVRYEGPLSDRALLARAYREARGFVLWSTSESLSLSALEAAACETRLLLSDLPWAKSVFAAQASYLPARIAPERAAPFLRAFYDQAPNLPAPPRPLTWLEVARQLKSVYERL